MRLTLSIAALGFALSACGGDDGDGGESEVSCAMGATLTGDVNQRISADVDSTACLVSQSFDSGLFASFVPDKSVSMSLDIANVTEGQTGSGFPTEIGVIRQQDGRSYSTSASGCSATITEHELESTEMGETAEVRHYHLVGTAVCTEPALPDDGGSGQISIADVVFVFTPFWSD